ncbi:MAG: hypothetical protein Q8P23_00780 [bacterium]|nr:hypothetical protein [bacterium]
MTIVAAHSGGFSELGTNSARVSLNGRFSAALRHDIPAFHSPRSVVNSQNIAAPTMTVRFTGEVVNTGNVRISVTARLKAVSSGGALKSSEATQIFVIDPENPNDPEAHIKLVTLAQSVSEKDLPGSISATAWLTDSSGNTISNTSKSSGVIGTIEETSVPFLTGTFTLGV